VAAQRPGLTQALGAHIVDKAQFRETIICTGAVGAMFGAFPAIAVLAFRFDHGHIPGGSRSLFALAFDLGLIFFASIAFCVFFFGLLPMGIQQGFVWLVHRWTGRA